MVTTNDKPTLLFWLLISEMKVYATYIKQQMVTALAY